MQLTMAAAWLAGRAGHTLAHPRLPAGRSARAGLAAVLVAAIGLGVGGYLLWGRGGLPDDAALAVGDQVVTVGEYADRVDALQALYGVTPPTGDPAKMDRFRRSAAQAIAESLVLQHAARQRGIVVGRGAARRVLDKYIAAEIGPGPDGQSTFTEIMGNVGTSRRVVLDEITQQLAVRRLFDRITGGVSVTEPQLRAAFPRYRNRLGTPERRHLLNIVVKSRQRAADIATRLGSGARFGALARKFSLDGATRDEGGDLGFVAAAQLQEPYARAAFSTPRGQVFGPVQNQYGWNVGKVVGVKAAVPARYPAVKQQLRNLVELNRRLARWSDWLATAIARAEVRYADEYRPAHPNQAPSVAGPGSGLPGAGAGGSGPR